MNTQTYRQPDVEMDLKEVIWSLLAQWKALLVVALIMSMLTVGIKHANDLTAYNNAIDSRQKAEEIQRIPAEEQIEKVLDNLSDDDRIAVEYLIQQKDWLEEERGYFNNSILLKVDPTNQRTLMLDYLIKSTDNYTDTISSLFYGYSYYINDESIVGSLRELIAPEAEIRYITELISTQFNANGLDPNLSGIYNGEAVLNVKVVLPEEVDAQAVEKAITSALVEYSAKLSKTVGDHTIRLINTNEARLYNSTAVNTRNSIISNIYNIQNTYIKNMEAALSEKQKAAVEAIAKIKDITKEGASSKEEEEKLTRPMYSKKYAAMGFLLGIILYVCVYLVLLLLRGRVNSPKALASYTGSRVLGEVQYIKKAKGLEVLFNSNYVNRVRYKGNEDATLQIDKAVSTIGSVCKHAHIDEITILNMGGEESPGCEVAQSIATSMIDKGIKSVVIDASGAVNEELLLLVKNAVIISTKESKLTDLWNLTELCHNYNINILGSVYLSR